MPSIGTFPFGEPVLPVSQVDKTPKRVFVLGVYASAVHARWIGPDKRVRVQALAVRSEPYIFWRGEGADDLISRIDVPPAAGKLVPATPHLNGPSGVALDERILAPLGLTREHAWLCDLIPHSLANRDQADAVRREYVPLAEELGLPKWSVPSAPRVLADATRQETIAAELRESHAEVLILLGDLPIRWFLSVYAPQRRKLLEFGVTPESYGRLHEIVIDGRTLCALPIAHPRQIARLGRSSIRWYELHQTWIEGTAPTLLA